MPDQLAKLVISLHWAHPDGSLIYDDLTVVPTSAAYYDVTLHQRTVKSKTSFALRMSMLSNYLSVFFTTILADRNPPTFVQIDMPMYPCVLLKRADIISYSEVMSAQLDTLTDDWPTETLSVSVSP